MQQLKDGFPQVATRESCGLSWFKIPFHPPRVTSRSQSRLHEERVLSQPAFPLLISSIFIVLSGRTSDTGKNLMCRPILHPLDIQTSLLPLFQHLFTRTDDLLPCLLHVLLFRIRVRTDDSEERLTRRTGASKEDLSSLGDPVNNNLRQRVRYRIRISHRSRRLKDRIHCVPRRRFRHPICQRLLLPAAVRRHRLRLDSKTSQRKHRPSHHLKQIPPPRDPPRKHLPQPNRPLNMLLHPLNPIAPHNKPDLQRPESPSQWNLPIPIIRDKSRIRVFVRVVRRTNRQRSRQIPAILDEQTRSVEIDKQPFVHIHVEGIEVGEEVAVLFLVLGEDEGCAGVGGVNVDPEVGVLCEDGDEGGEVVDAAGGGCAEGEGDVVGFETFLFALLEGRGEVVACKREVVGSGGGNGHVSGSGYAGAFLGGGVGLVGREGDEFAAELAYPVLTFGGVGRNAFGVAFRVEVAFTGCDHAGDYCFGGGALNYATAALWGGGEVG